jgi:hypothetical protein
VRYKGERKDLAEIKQEDYGKKEEIWEFMSIGQHKSETAKKKECDVFYKKICLVWNYTFSIFF